MSNKRDVVNYNPNERVDLLDMMAQQYNARLDIRTVIGGLVFGLNEDRMNAVIDGFLVTADSPASSQVNIAWGVGIGGERLADQNIEFGALFGLDTDETKALDFGALASATYSVYVKLSVDLGAEATRAFHNPDSNNEEAASMSTRVVFDWDVTTGTVSPGDEWQEIASVVWGGSTIATGDITQKQTFVFEGPTPIAATWGDGVDDRDDDRATNGLKSLYGWAGAVRRQLADIIGTVTETGWYKAIPISMQGVIDKFTGLSEIASIWLTTFESYTIIDTTTGDAGLAGSSAAFPTVVRNIGAVDLHRGTANVLGGGPDLDLKINGAFDTTRLALCATGDGAGQRWLQLDFDGGGGADLRTLVVRGKHLTGTDTTITVSVTEVDLTDGTYSTVLEIEKHFVAGDATDEFLIGTATELSIPLDLVSNYYYLTVIMDSADDSGLGIFTVRYSYERSHFFTWGLPVPLFETVEDAVTIP